MGLLHRNRCVGPIRGVYCAPLTAGSIISLVYSSRFLWCKVVFEQLLEDGCGGLSGELIAAELLLGLLMHVAGHPPGHADAVRRAELCFYCMLYIPRGCTDKTPTRSVN